MEKSVQTERGIVTEETVKQVFDTVSYGNDIKEINFLDDEILVEYGDNSFISSLKVNLHDAPEELFTEPESGIHRIARDLDSDYRGVIQVDEKFGLIDMRVEGKLGAGDIDHVINELGYVIVAVEPREENVVRLWFDETDKIIK